MNTPIMINREARATMTGGDLRAGFTIILPGFYDE
jgi:hypothetical protein